MSALRHLEQWLTHRADEGVSFVHAENIAEAIDALIKLRIEQALRTNAAIGPEVIAKIREAWEQ